MVISHTFRFVFIKTKKTAGTSLECLFSDICGIDDVVTPISPPEPHHRPRNHDGFYNHMTALEVRERVGHEVWDSYFTFTVERNPFEKVVSFWSMARVREGRPDLTLDKFLERNEIGINWPTYTDLQGQIIVDRVLRYESLQMDLREVATSLGFPFSGTLDHRAKSQYRLDRRPAREILSPTQVKTISVRFQKEIEWFGYESC